VQASMKLEKPFDAGSLCWDGHMMKRSFLALICVPFFFFGGVGNSQPQESKTKESIITEFAGKVPQEWGKAVTGVKTRLNTDQKVIALTFDACGHPRGNGYDKKLIHYLQQEGIGATLFISGTWIDANPNIFGQLARISLFEIENHGLNHKPCSVNGRSAYGIEGTSSVGELVDEIEQNGVKIQSLTGRKPRYYRPGTAHCDEIGVRVAYALGYEVVSFSILGDGGASFSRNEVKQALLNAPPSSIVLMHMNHPDGETAEGLMDAIPQLRKRGFRFDRLSQYSLR
jgi:peptidoglycan/xylan/chitin deacetylase (PgdA/CDA1 family)